MSEPTISSALIRADELSSPLLVLHLFERERSPQGFVAKIDQRFGGAIRRVLESGDFTGRKDETLVLYPAAPELPIRRVLLVGVGKPEDHTVERLRRAVGGAIRAAERLGVSELDLSLGHMRHTSERVGDYFSGLAAVEAALLAMWDFRELKTAREENEPRGSVQRVRLIAHDDANQREFQRAVDHGTITARGANIARDLQTRPGNVLTPTVLAERTRELGAAVGLTVNVLDRAAIEAEGMKALLAVAQGSHQEPRFIVIEHRGAGEAKPVVLVGKGVTFDSGGISIKPAERMEDMKYDMSGAAAVIGAMHAIAQLKLKVNAIGLVPATENLPSGSAYKPGDVIGTHLGKTVEIVNTDAEGRLILADALSYARRFQPAAVLDAATLTGAVVIALGQHAIGLMGNDGDLMDEVQAAGHRVGDRCWPLPLWDEYRPQIDSTIADIKNSGGRAAGTITAGWFLKEFVDYPWVHLDVAGTAYRDEAAPYLRKGATGVPTRLFVEWVKARAEK